MATEIATGILHYIVGAINNYQNTREISNEYELGANIKARIDHVRAKGIPNKEIFLRELILNASAAMDKYRYESLTKKPTRREFPELAILIEVNKSDRTISITDSGIGFTKGELAYLFCDMINPRAQPIHGAWLIDAMVEQLGIGFYSVFAVADKVVIITKHAENVGLSWILSSKGKYMVNKDPSFPLSHGNKVIIYLKKDALNYMKKETIMDIISKYVSFLEYPIKYIDGSEIAPHAEQIPTLNYGGALWKRKLTQSCYQKLYKFLSRDTENCLTFKVMKGGESFTFTAVLFVPRRAPSDFFMLANPDKKILLYLNGVRVTDEYEELLPDDLRFIRGIVNVDDLFFSISQKEALSKVILSNVRVRLLKIVLKWYGELTKVKEVFPIFWEQFGRLDFPLTDKERLLHMRHEVEFAEFCQWMEKILCGSVEKVVVSQRLFAWPCCVVAPEGAYTSKIQATLEANRIRDSRLCQNMLNRKIFEINPSNPLIQKLRSEFLVNKKDPQLNSYIYLLFAAHAIAGGFAINNPDRYQLEVNNLIRETMELPQLDDYKGKDEDSNDDNDDNDNDVAAVNHGNFLTNICVIS